ncbi:hypothetical protein QBC34DRAFT_381233 [Podospora aff. communis PSN243]|uniref:Uncharacterized protein n=1 Tax=Podospora aff. communis PSN243 TaxID=3040156 RepID=A0AAV9GM19_9PEZI|nr:hypothetical protein QBC34DRAFT_381233 [Podospora aff. communis PSN243]
MFGRGKKKPVVPEAQPEPANPLLDPLREALVASPSPDSNLKQPTGSHYKNKPEDKREPKTLNTSDPEYKDKPKPLRLISPAPEPISPPPEPTYPPPNTPRPRASSAFSAQAPYFSPVTTSKLLDRTESQSLNQSLQEFHFPGSPATLNTEPLTLDIAAANFCTPLDNQHIVLPPADNDINVVHRVHKKTPVPCSICGRGISRQKKPKPFPVRVAKRVVRYASRLTHTLKGAKYKCKRKLIGWKDKCKRKFNSVRRSMRSRRNKWSKRTRPEDVLLQRETGPVPVGDV